MPARRTIAAALAMAVRRLDAASATPHLDAELLLAHCLREPRSLLRAGDERELEASVHESFDAFVARRAAGEPVAYITGCREFWSLDLAVTASVLVPRPETELLVERALALEVESAAVVDLGTGSGAIALALACERPMWRITAVEVSREALEVAWANAARLGVRHVEFLEGDWFAPLARRRFDVIVSNPPYIAASDPILHTPELGFEPRLALTPGEDALAALRHIADASPGHLVSGGHLILEHGATQDRDLAELLVARGFTHVRCHPDLAGHARVTEARWP